MNYYNKIALYIKRKRKEKDMSQMQLALNSGVPLGYICRLETQKITHPSIIHIINIVKAFDDNLSDLLEEIES